ncbi:MULTISPECIES: MFS transporter [Paracoccus]|uniref:Major facilitator superfamily protein n=1 Tax=Paracoccus kondratievae TaxID=135740 RepID=A0AAD3RVA7_9RHOB|nr:MULTISPECIES: MFS transporter [Paracoccus]GLK65687.1 major facilitator superfamily protein [Paracoccus kondratievae]
MHLKSTLNVGSQFKAEALAVRHISLLALLMACGFMVVGQLYVTIPMVAEISARFGIDPAQAALAGTAFGVAYAAGFLLFGPMSDRLGRKRMILIGLIATAIATGLVALADSFQALLAARAVQGLAASIFPPVALSLVTEELPPKHRPLGVSLMSFAFLGAAPLAQLFAAWAPGGMTQTMLQLAPFYLLGAAGLFFAVSAGRATLASAPVSGGSRLGSLLRDPVILAAWAAAVTVLFGFVSFYGGAQALGAQLGIDLQTLRLIGLPPLLLAFAAAPLTRRYGATVTARAGLVLAALALAIATAGSSLAIGAAAAALAAGVALAVPGLIATVAGRASNTNRGLALAIYSFALFLGASFAPPVAQTLGRIGTVPLWLCPAALLLLATLALSVGVRRGQSAA